MAEGPVLIITGASSGIGAETARHAAREGYRLVLGARRAEPLAELAEELGGPSRAVAECPPAAEDQAFIDAISEGIFDLDER